MRVNLWFSTVLVCKRLTAYEAFGGRVFRAVQFQGVALRCCCWELRSDYTQHGGFIPLCYPDDVTPDLLAANRQRMAQR